MHLNSIYRHTHTQGNRYFRPVQRVVIGIHRYSGTVHPSTPQTDPSKVNLYWASTPHGQDRREAFSVMFKNKVSPEGYTPRTMRSKIK